MDGLQLYEGEKEELIRIVTGEQMEGVIAVVVVEEGGSAGFGTVLGKELKGGLHKADAALGVEVVVTDKSLIH